MEIFFIFTSTAVTCQVLITPYLQLPAFPDNIPSEHVKISAKSDMGFTQFIDDFLAVFIQSCSFFPLRLEKKTVIQSGKCLRACRYLYRHRQYRRISTFFQYRHIGYRQTFSTPFSVNLNLENIGNIGISAITNIGVLAYRQNCHIRHALKNVISFIN